MTLHIGMFTHNRDAFVWITDRLARLGKTDYGTVEKITYLETQKFACSIWGDTFAMRARDELIDRLQKGAFICHSDPSRMVVSLKEFGTQMFQVVRGDLQAHQANNPRGILLVSLENNPQAYSLGLGWPILAVPVIGQVTHGDDDNPALLFTNYYYERCGKTINELLSLGVHAMRIAERMNTKGIRGVDAWIFTKAACRHLTTEELVPYLELSDSLDADILTKIAPPRHRIQESH